MVVDDDTQGRARVQLVAEVLETYDVAFYADKLLRAAASVLAPLGWREEEIRAHLADGHTPLLAAFTGE